MSRVGYCPAALQCSKFCHIPVLQIDRTWVQWTHQPQLKPPYLQRERALPPSSWYSACLAEERIDSAINICERVPEARCCPGGCLVAICRHVSVSFLQHHFELIAADETVNHDFAHAV